MLAILFYILLIPCTALTQEFSKKVQVFEHERQKKYYFELLPTDIKHVFKNFAANHSIFLGNAFQQNDVDFIKCTAFLFSSELLDALFAQYAFNAYCCCDPKNRIALAQLYLDLGGDPNKKLRVMNNTTFKPLFLAACSNSEQVVKLLLDAGARVVKECEIPQPKVYTIDCAYLFPYDENCYIDSSLFRAIENHNVAIVRMLLEKGADPYEKICYKRKIYSAENDTCWKEYFLSKEILQICKEEWGNSTAHKEVLALVERWP